MALLTSENFAEAIVKIVATTALETLVPKLVMGRLANRRYEGQLNQYGDVINIPIAPDMMTPNAIGMSGTIVPQTPSMGNAQIVLNAHYENSFELPSAVASTLNVNAVASYMDASIKGLASQIESSLLAVYPLFSQTPVGGNTALGEATVDSAEQALFAAKVPPTQRKHLVVHQSPYSALRQTAAFRDFQTVGFAAGGPGVTPPIMSGRLPGADANPLGMDGMVKGFEVYRSQLVPSLSVSSQTQYQNIAFAEDAIGLVVKQLPITTNPGVIQYYMEYGNFGLRITSSFQHSVLADMYTVDAMWGTAALRPQFGIVVESL